MLQQAVADAAGALETFVTHQHRRRASGTPTEPSTTKAEPLLLSFACGGWYKYYMFAVAKAIKDHGLADDARFIGSSAGALTALGLALGSSEDFDKAVHYSKTHCMPECRGTLMGPARIAKYTSNCLDLHGHLDRYHELNDGRRRLTVCLTALPSLRPVRVSEFESAAELKASLMASAAFFPFAPLVRFRGQWCLDGGLSDFQPVFDEEEEEEGRGRRTVTVSPFYFSGADIKPSRYVPLWWLVLPPSDPEAIDWLYDLGYCDALSYFHRQGLLRCQHREEGADQHTHACRMRPCRNPHPYDGPLTSCTRFLGYGRPHCSSSSSAVSVGLVLDVLVAFWLGALWRPVALALIYCELTLRAALLSGRALIRGSERLLPWLSSACAAVYLCGPSPLFLLTLAVVAAYLLAMSLLVCSSLALRDWRVVAELCSALFSGSLLLRGLLPCSDSFITLNKQQVLLAQSVIYRLHVHLL